VRRNDAHTTTIPEAVFMALHAYRPIYITRRTIGTRWLSSFWYASSILICIM
jgi:hypothetical protein